jgi:diacylglycerol kinase (ATP)
MPHEAGAAARACLVINPRSFRAAWLGYARRATRLAAATGLEVFRIVDPASLRTLLAGLRERRQQQIWVLAGDGTVHALAEYFAEQSGGDWTPALLLLAGGRANVVPRETGGYPAMPALRRALAAYAAGRALPEERVITLRVSQAGQPQRHGFLFAGAMIYEGVRLCAEHRAAGTSWLHRGYFADPYALLRLGVQVLIGRSPLPPYPEVAARVDGLAEMTAPLRVLVASTLALHDAHYNPFAERGTGPVRLTAVAATAARFWRRLPAILRGRFDERMDAAAGYLSGRGEQVELRGVSGYALDGEIFRTDPALPLVLSPGIALRMMRA